MTLWVVLIVLFLVFIFGVWLTFNLLGLLVTLAIAGLVGWLADRIVPGDLPYGWLGAVVAGLAGGWLGSLIVGHVGPEIGGISIIPALLGAIILAFVADLVLRATQG